jgi:hypothetical protein
MGISKVGERLTVLQLEMESMAHRNKWVDNSAFARQRGFALPLAMGLGLVMIALATTATIVAQSDRKTSASRRQTSSSTFVTEGGIARLLVKLRDPRNAVLLSRSYDPINPSTNRNYLGADGILNSNDETAVAINEWSTVSTATHTCATAAGINRPPQPDALNTFFGSLDNPPNALSPRTYSLKAYRYNAIEQMGSLLVEGVEGNTTSHILVRFSIIPDARDFPGILVSQTLYLQGRSISSGNNGNVYFNYDDNDGDEFINSPVLRGKVSRSDSNRSQFLDAIFAGAKDGLGSDPVSGNLVACPVTFSSVIDDQPAGTKFKNLKDIDDIVAAPGINGYVINKGEMKGNDILTVDTTKGKVYLYIQGQIVLKNNAKIINIRTDGKPPRVGDLRIISFKDSKDKADRIALFDNACIQNAFIFNSTSDLQIQTTGNGCPGGRGSVEGVAWVEDLLSSRNSSGSRKDPDKDGDLQTKAGTTSGFVIPSDITGLEDMLEELRWPIQYKFGEIKSWQRVRL